MFLRLVSTIEPKMKSIILCSLGLNYSIISISSLSLLIAPVNFVRPSCLPALLLLVRGGVSGLATAVLDTWLGFGLGAFSRRSVLNCLPSSFSSILALALAGLSFELKVFSKLACVLLTFISTAGTAYVEKKNLGICIWERLGIRSAC